MMKYLEQRDQIIQNLRDLFAQLSEETDEAKRGEIESKCHEQLDRLDEIDGKRAADDAK